MFTRRITSSISISLTTNCIFRISSLICDFSKFNSSFSLVTVFCKRTNFLFKLNLLNNKQMFNLILTTKCSYCLTCSLKVQFYCRESPVALQRSIDDRSFFELIFVVKCKRKLLFRKYHFHKKWDKRIYLRLLISIQWTSISII